MLQIPTALYPTGEDITDWWSNGAYSIWKAGDYYYLRQHTASDAYPSYFGLPTQLADGSWTNDPVAQFNDGYGDDPGDEVWIDYTPTQYNHVGGDGTQCCKSDIRFVGPYGVSPSINAHFHCYVGTLWKHRECNLGAPTPYTTYTLTQTQKPRSGNKDSSPDSTITQDPIWTYRSSTKWGIYTHRTNPNSKIQVGVPIINFSNGMRAAYLRTATSWRLYIIEKPTWPEFELRTPLIYSSNRFYIRFTLTDGWYADTQNIPYKSTSPQLTIPRSYYNPSTPDPYAALPLTATYGGCVGPDDALLIDCPKTLLSISVGTMERLRWPVL